MKRVLVVFIVVIVSIVLLYISRFWPVELWTRRSTLGDLGLRPGGGLLAIWLRGTPLAQFELILWAAGSFLALSVTEKLVQRLK